MRRARELREVTASLFFPALFLFCAVQKQMEVLMLNEEFLTEQLSGENKKKFLDFVNAWSVVNGESNLDSFIMGFR